ncbi:sarcosine oxidase subunit alpha family protein [Bradyrhizobium sp. Tv2a-2]|uniref:sarcosine oxidase subunit alpha family protein n=1 Tax=Bradyrhizobium sp. Tv2a-2 TaxID=113395 RepID=UPI0003FE2EB8|nr:sarcosine oxidase subunit alpha family protein [Bradyrhizobium sp. Tv2a-2]
MSAHRRLQGGHIDRCKRLTFHFDGRRLFGHPGDTLASALLASGIRVVGRSFKYHRPRGIMTAGPDEPSALVELRVGSRTEPNTKMTEVELYEGLQARSQNRWPSLKFDLMAVSGLFGNMISCGFYYKTFMWPASFWERFYEPLIRHAAGLGRATCLPDPDHYEAVHAHCDVLIVGSGPAGLAAARVAGEAGARVILCERDFLPGGGLLLDPAQEIWRKEMITALERIPDVQILLRTNVFGYYDHNLLGGVEQVSDHVPEPRPHAVRQRYRTFRARHVVLATGASERLIAFRGNDRPGVMMAGAALTYVHRFGIAPGKRAVVFTNNDSAYATAFALAAAGLDGVVLADVRRESRLAAKLRAHDVDVRLGVEVNGFGTDAVTLEAQSGGRNTVRADLLCVSGGWNPNVDLASQSGAKLTWDAALATFIPGAPAQAERSVGAAHGISGIGEAARDGLAAGLVAAKISGFGGGCLDFPLPALDGSCASIEPLWEVKTSGKAFVDLQHDVTANDIRQAHREGFSHIEHAKRYTTHSMATDQGKLGGLLGAAILAEARGETLEKVGLPTFRPYTKPAAIGALAGGATGKRFQPVRRTALHAWHLHNGAVMKPTGPWLRPFYYSAAAETGWAAVLREARGVRQSVGICDVSTLGKIDLQGPDAATFLDRLYINSLSPVAVGKCRYGLMLREDGIAFDDGTISRLDRDHFLVTTTTANAEAVLEHMEFYAQTVWPELDVSLCSVTDQWAQIAVAGPRSGMTLANAVEGLDLSNAAFGFMSVGEGRVAAIPVRVFRISFSGELAYEIAVPSRHALTVWQTILTAGQEFGIVPYGLEAMDLMRIEKGHVAGSELNGQTTAADLGMDRMMKSTGDFIGRVLSARPALADPSRPRLVGIRPIESGMPLRCGAHLMSKLGSGTSLGWITSVTQSIVLGHWIGLAMLENGVAMNGNTVYAVSHLHDETIEVVVSSPNHVDPENVRGRS